MENLVRILAMEKGMLHFSAVEEEYDAALGIDPDGDMLIFRRSTLDVCKHGPGAVMTDATSDSKQFTTWMFMFGPACPYTDFYQALSNTRISTYRPTFDFFITEDESYQVQAAMEGMEQLLLIAERLR